MYHPPRFTNKLALGRDETVCAMSTSDSVEIRPVERGDVSTILNLYGDALESGSDRDSSANEPWVDSAWDRMMRSGQHLLVAVLGGQVLAR